MFGKEKEKAFNDDDSDSGVSRSERSFNRNEVLLCATHGKIYAVHKADGTRLWRAKFPTGAMGGIVSLFITDYDRLIVGGNGKTACMDLFTGETIWINKMKVRKILGRESTHRIRGGGVSLLTRPANSNTSYLTHDRDVGTTKSA